MDEPSRGSAGPDRLDSWKEIAAYLKRDVTTVQRWEKREGLPVHRHQHDKLASVYAYRSELEAWSAARRPEPSEAPEPTADLGHRAVSRTAVLAAAVVLAVAAGVFLWWVSSRRLPDGERFANATFRRLTDFDGIEQAAAISPDGRFVAFLSDRDGKMDVWITQMGSGRLYNLTHGRFAELVNPSIRSLGFSPDGALVTFWARHASGSAGDISIWAVPLLGGDPRPYLEGAAEVRWSSDGSHVVYHTPGPGDPMFVAASLHERPERSIFKASEGLHAHFPEWSPDGAFIYMAQGTPPDAMDLWRMRADGGAVERITTHNSRVSHPVFLDDRTLAYLATDRDGSGPWLYTIDLEERVPHRVSRQFDRYTSLAASADGRRIVATLADPKVTLWRIAPDAGESSAPLPISLPTGRGTAPRLGPGYLLCVSAGETGDSVWKIADSGAAEVWSEPGARVIGGPEISADGRRFVMSVEQGGRTLLYTMGVDGTNKRVISSALALRGAPNWAGDGRSIISALDVSGTPQLALIAADGSATPLVREYSVGPAASSSGDLVVYTGSDVGPTLKVGAITTAGAPRAVPDLTLTRGARRVRFIGDSLKLAALLGTLGHKDVWEIDLVTGARRQLTHLPAEFEVQDFDISPDGRDIVVQRVQEHADIVLIELPAVRR